MPRTNQKHGTRSLSVVPATTARDGPHWVIQYKQGQRIVYTQKRFALGGARSMELRMDIFNAMNVNTIKQRVTRSGPDFMRPFTGEAAAANVIILPRIVQLGASFSF